MIKNFESKAKQRNYSAVVQSRSEMTQFALDIRKLEILLEKVK